MAGFSPPMHERELSVHSLNAPVLEIAEEKRSKRNPRQLDFESAMDDFRIMFPGLDVELIESVLRANGGAVDDTIDQLLTITVDCKESAATSTMPSPPSRPPKPAGSLRSSNERLQSTNDNTPVLPPREGSLKRNTAKKTKTSSHQAPILYNTPKTRRDIEWNGMLIPMLGKLPADFLRVTHSEAPPPRPPKASKQRSQSLKNQIPTHLAEQPHITKTRANSLHHSKGPRPSTLKNNRQGHITTATGERLSSNALKRQIKANQRRLQESCDSNDLDGDTERFLEDERLALIMQNEEFLRELKRNEDFMKTLEFERDMLATRLAHEQKKNRQLTQLSPSVERGPHNWMAPRPSEIDENSLPRSLSPTSDIMSTRGSTHSAEDIRSATQADEPALPDCIVPVDRTDKTDVHDFRDQLKSMGATSKRKFALLAKKFFSTSRKKRRGTAKIVRNAHGPSTLNLLDDNDDEDLIDVSGSSHSPDEVLFEPLPDAWTSGNGLLSSDSDIRGDDTQEHFL